MKKIALILYWQKRALRGALRRCGALLIGLVLCAVQSTAADFLVTNSLNAGPGSLRQAILDANANPGYDEIDFDIPGAGVHTISLSSALPPITSAVLIDGLTQTGAVANNESESSQAVLVIEIDGNSLGIIGFDIAAGGGGSTLRGMSMHSFSGSAIRMQSGSGYNTVQSCFIGLLPDGMTIGGVGNQIEVYSHENLIGGTSGFWARNLLSGNPSAAAITVSGSGAYNNTIHGNFIGVARDGTTVIGGNERGMVFENGAHDCWVGDAGSALDNHIAGCTLQGIVARGALTYGIDLWGNRIYSNGGIAFDLNDDGVTANDVGDGDTGPNGLANFPTIVRGVTDELGDFYFQVQYDGLPNTLYRLDFYQSTSSAGNGDQLIWLGRTDGETDGAGLLDDYFTTGRWPVLEAGDYVTMTITNWDDRNTSESAANFQLGFGELRVTNINDNINGDVSNVLDLITSPGADGISLREAITAANNQETSWGTNHILFDIPGPGPHIIQPSSPLPPITQQIFINGASEPDYSGAPTVRVDGSSAGVANGLEVRSQWCDINGLSLVNFSGHGVYSNRGWCRMNSMYIGLLEDGVTPAGNGGFGVNIEDGTHWRVGIDFSTLSVIADNALGGVRITGSDSDNCSVSGCYIGTDASGNNTLGTQEVGVLVDNGASFTTIGNYGHHEWNVIAGHTGDGVRISGAACDVNKVLKCNIGVGRDGTTPLGNGDNGIEISAGAEFTKVGEPFFGNTISANASAGIFIRDNTTRATEIMANIIGLDASGSQPLANGSHGIYILTPDNVIGGPMSWARNIISANGGNGIAITGSAATNNEIINNYIGLAADGITPRGNTLNGIRISANAERTVVGGTMANSQNVISSNGQSGIALSGVDNTDILRNYIGVDGTGTIERGNTYSGIDIFNSNGNQIGTSPGSGGVISGNGIDGIRLANAQNNTIQRYRIGTNALGSNPIPNVGYGLQMNGACGNNVVGTDSDGTNDADEGNVISGNGAGVRLSSGSAATGNVIAGNYIGVDASGNSALPNATLGIDISSGFTQTIIGTDADGVNDENEGNVISGNTDVGMRVTSSGHFISGNIFGLGANGNTAIPNGDEHLYFGATASDIVVGHEPSMLNDEADEVGNQFSKSPTSALVIADNALRIRVSRNSFSDNHNLAIDLDNDLVTSNDDGDSDSGPNELFNFIVFDEAIIYGNAVTISGFAPSGAEIEFFEADGGESPDGHSFAQSFGEGERFLFSFTEGSSDDYDSTVDTYTNDGTGQGTTRTEARFEFSFSASSFGLSDGSLITCTAIEANGNTSEFSAVIALRAVEVCEDGIDNDGDGLIDCKDPDCYSYDNDADGVCDNQDLDDDNDGLLDTEECVTFGPELIQNGDFEDGYAHWRSDFSRGKNNFAATAGGCATQGWIAVSPCSSENGECLEYYRYDGGTSDGSVLITDPVGTGANLLSTTTCNETAWNCLAEGLPDHTTGTGNSLYVDPNDIVGEAYVRQEVIIAPNTYYEFSAWIMVIEEDPNLQFRIDGFDLTTPIDLNRLTPGNDGADVWQRVSSSWYSGSNSGAAELALVNLTTGCGGNDIRLDDVSFRQINIDDTDGDGIADCYDLDSDGDGCPDVLEAGFSDSEYDGELAASPVTVDSDGLVINGTDGYTGITAFVKDAAQQSGCPDFDSDLISDGNDEDDDNDGILDNTEFNCSGSWLAFNATWTQSNAANDAVQIQNPTVIASTAPLTFGAGSNGVSVNSRVEFSSLDSKTFAEARQEEDYIQFAFTTQATIKSVLLGEMSHNKAPASSGATPAEYGYQVGILISDDGFATHQTLEYGYHVDETLPAGWDNDFMLGDNEDYQFEPNTTYTVRVYLFDKTSSGPARFDDFAVLTYHCSNPLDPDNDDAYSHQDPDADGDSCFDVIEAGFPDADGDGQLGGLSPPTVNAAGRVTSGGL